MKSSWLLAVAATAALSAACASTPPADPRIVSARNDLNQLTRDSLSATAAPEAIASAQAALKRAEEARLQRDPEALVHEVRMVNGNVRLARAEIAAVRSETEITQIEARKEQAALALTRRDVVDAETDAATARADALSSKQQVAGLRADLLAAYETRQTELGTMLVLRDVLFEVGSANLRTGAEQRLNPLADYLKQHSNVEARIDGHTDSTGNTASNQTLSQRRAEAVADYISSRGVSRSRFQTYGFGEDRPVGSNASPSGREENRRVEVTLLGS